MLVSQSRSEKLEKIKLDAVFINSTKADGNPYITSKGAPFKIAVIKWDDKQASKMVFDDDDPVTKWQQGDEVEVVLKQNGEYTNFDLPKQADLLEQRMDRLEKIVAKLIKER